MLPSHYRVQVQNDGLGTTVDVEVRINGIQIDTSNAQPTYGSWSADLGVSGLADGAFGQTADQDNTADGYNAIEVEVTLSSFGGTPNDAGQVVVYFQGRGDGSTDWPDDGEGFVAMVFDPDSTGTYRKTQRIG